MIVANGRRRWEGGAGHAAFPDFFRALISLESGKLALRAQTNTRIRWQYVPLYEMLAMLLQDRLRYTMDIQLSHNTKVPDCRLGI